MSDLAVGNLVIRAIRLAGRNSARLLLALSALFLLLVGLGPLTGAYRTVTVLSGSMGPGMPVGAVAVLAPVNPAAVKVGDVITFQAPIADHPVVTHRVVEILEGGPHPVLRTKGDANLSADPWSARIESSPAWRRVAVVPYAGTVIRTLRSAPVHLATVQIVPVVLLAVLLWAIWSRGSKGPDRGRRAAAGRRTRPVATKRPIVRLTAALMAGGTAIGVSPARATFVGFPVPTPSQTLTAKEDWVPPQASSIIAKATAGYLTGSIRQGSSGGTYYVYANITESGNPASGITAETKTTNVSALTAGGTAVTLTPGTYLVNGVTYAYRSALQTPTGTLTEGVKAYSIAALTDLAGNAGTQTGFTVTVDNTKPFASDVQTVNGGGTVGKAEQGDTITFTFSEQIDPASVLATWTGASQSVTMRLIDGGCALFVLCGDDTFAIYNAANTSPLPLGTVNLNRSDYNGGSLLGSKPSVYFLNSTMVASGSAITITLGPASNGTAETAGGNGAMNWDSDATPFDAAGNVALGEARGEGGTSDRDF